jgi:hypothetical protein
MILAGFTVAATTASKFLLASKIASAAGSTVFMVKKMKEKRGK